MDHKKYIPIAISILILLCSRAVGQNTGFTQQENIKTAGIVADSQVYPLTVMQKQTTRLYYDGLGRSLQTVAVQASPLQHDLIQPVAYDNLGRQTVGYLPYAGQAADVTGSYRSNAVSTAQPNFYNQTSQYLIPLDTAAHMRQVFENSPLQRLLTAGTAGTGFQPTGSGTEHYKSVSYRPNNSNTDGSILLWNTNGIYSGRAYTAGSLSVTDGVDEDNTETLTFTDLEGHLILKRQVVASGSYLDTYYIYNLAGMISYIVPPKATGLLAANSYSLTAAPLSNLVFSYVYNTRGQLSQKTVPGKGTLYVVYDPLHRPVLLQDARMLALNKWNYIKYDAKGRAVAQGIYYDNTHTGQANMQAYVNTLSSAYTSTWCESRTATVTGGGYYTSTVFPTANLTPLAYVYFDDYYLTQGSSPDFSYAKQNDASLPNEETATAAQLKGMPTMVCKSTMGSGLSNTWLTTVTFYDRRLHPIQVRSNNHVYYNGYITSAALTDTKTVVTDFIGATLNAKVSKQTASSATVTVYTGITYDHMYRVTGISQQYNTGSSQAVAAYTYNELGQVIKKGLGFVNATTWLQNVDMRYNIRGQLLYINNSTLTNDNGVTNSDANDVFGLQLFYDGPGPNLNNGTGNTPSYNGKVSAVKWMSKDGSGNPSKERSYTYSYDNLNRYTGETYAERVTAGTGTFSNNLHGFDETGISYDAGGNILSLNRNSSTQGTNSNVQTDKLTYTYSGSNPNQLASVADASGNSAGFIGGSGSYAYDPNGSLTTDPYKNLTLSYDDLNRTDKIIINSGTKRFINYTYDGSGQLIRKQAYDNNTLQTTTDYVDGFNYMNGTLSYFPMPEGRVLNNSGTLTQEFIITDQQGNARVSFQNNGSGTAVVKQENSYYAFGLLLPNSPVGTPPTPNKQLYNGGSEWQNDFGNQPDYQQTFNRNYDAALGRFIGVDPMAESAESMTSYQYAGNNPVMLNDPMGDLIDPSKSLPHGYTNPAQPGGVTGGSLLDGDPNGGLDSGGSNGGGDPDIFGGSYYGSTSAIDGGDYTQAWTGILSGSGISLNANGSAYLNSNSNTPSYTLNSSAGTVMLGFSPDGQLTSYSVNTDLGPHGVLATQNGSYINATQTLLNLGEKIDVEEGNLLSDAWGWAKAHFYSSEDYEVSFGLQAGGGIVRGLDVYYNVHSAILAEGHLGTDPANIKTYGGGNKTSSGWGLAALFGLEVKEVNEGQDYSKTTSVGILGVIGGSITEDGDRNVTHWDFGIDVSVRVAAFIGLSGEYKVGFESK